MSFYPYRRFRVAILALFRSLESQKSKHLSIKLVDPIQNGPWVIKNRKPSRNLYYLVFPGLMQIIANPPFIIVPVSSFNYNSSLLPKNNGLASIEINNSPDTDFSKAVPITNVNISSFSNFTNKTTDISLNNKMVINPSKQTFSLHYVGSILILVECTDSNLENWNSYKTIGSFTIIFLLSLTSNLPGLKIPFSSSSYRVISIPIPNSNTSFCPITLSSKYLNV